MVDLYNTFCKALDEDKEVRVVFLDISKSFDRIWHKGLLFKFKQADINPILPVISQIETESTYSWLASYPLRQVTRKVHFRASTIRLFAYDTSLYLIVDNPADAARSLNSDLEYMYHWAESWLVKLMQKSQKRFLFQGKQIDLYIPNSQ